MSNKSFPYRTIREIDVGYANVWCARMTYVGELGYELYIPVEHALHVYEHILAHGNDSGDDDSGNDDAVGGGGRDGGGSCSCSGSGSGNSSGDNIKRGPHLQLKHAGLKALASLRMEKGYRDYGHDMDNCDTLLEGM